MPVGKNFTYLGIFMWSCARLPVQLSEFGDPWEFFWIFNVSGLIYLLTYVEVDFCEGILI
jgi:hypothetical protein